MSLFTVSTRLFIAKILDKLLYVIGTDFFHSECAEHGHEFFADDLFVKGKGVGGEGRLFDIEVFFAELGKADSVGALLYAIGCDFFLKGFDERIDLFVELLIRKIGL